MKVKYQDLEVEFDIAPVLISAVSRLKIFRQKSPLQRLKCAIALISSTLYALREGTEIPTSSGVFRAAPLLKPLPDGSAVLVRSGYPVTGTWDAIGQVELGHTLGSLGKSFYVSHDSDPSLSFDQNLICFGSPTSNAISGQIYDRLESVTSRHFRWGDNYSSFFLNNDQFSSGNEGVVVCCRSPFGPNWKVLVLSGIGPMVTLGCCKLISNWHQYVICPKQRKADKFIAAVRYDIKHDGEKNLLLRRFIILDQ